jgi:hypothetical protein
MGKFLVDKKEKAIYKLEVNQFTPLEWQEIIELPDVDDVNDLVYENDQIRLISLDEKIAKLQQIILYDLDITLEILFDRSDYVIIKLAELEFLIKSQNITQEEYENNVKKYNDLLQQRYQIREWANNIKNNVMSTTNLDNLNQIRNEIINARFNILDNLAKDED